MRAGSESIAAVKSAEWSLDASSAGIAGPLRSVGTPRAREASPGDARQAACIQRLVETSSVCRRSRLLEEE